MLFKILWFIIKWALIIGIPGFLIAAFRASRRNYNRHKHIKRQISKKAYITFEEFEKLYPVSADRWFFKCRYGEDYCLNSSNLILNRDDEDIYCLYFNSGRAPAWAAPEYFYTQMIFKTYRDFNKYYIWLVKREEAIKKQRIFQQQKADLETMEEVLCVVQADIDKIKKDADKKIEESLKTTIEVSARINDADNEDAIQKLFEVI